MKIFQNIDQLKTELMEIINTRGINLISFDGRDGSGKSFLTEYLCEDNGYVHLNLDDARYLIEEQGTYVDFIRYENLKKDISKNLDLNKVILLDGICILKILKKIDVYPDLKIYVKKLKWDGFWFEGQNFDYTRDVEEILHEEEEEHKRFMEIEANIENRPLEKYDERESIFHEIIRYHHEYKPDENADIVFERIEE